MTATATDHRGHVLNGPLERHDLPVLLRGLREASIGLADDELGQLPESDAGRSTAMILAFENVIEAAVVEVAPQVQELLYQAVERRLPWTWEPER